jgi:excisionase family DNA binding protein
MLEPLVMSLPDCAQTLGVSVGLLRKLARSGQLRTVRIGRCVRIPCSELLRLSGEVNGTQVASLKLSVRSEEEASD